MNISVVITTYNRPYFFKGGPYISDAANARCSRCHYNRRLFDQIIE